MAINQPLADRMRPNNLDDFFGQEKLAGKNGIIRKMIESGKLASFILWGPPGVGKTTLARIVSSSLDRPFYTLSAINSGVKDVREVIEKAGKAHFFDRPAPILFIDEIHRFNKSQQDSLLSAVEQGTVILIGATTENPSFEVISPLLSRCQVYILESLSKKTLQELLKKALDQDIYLKQLNVNIQEEEAFIKYSGGDARKLFNALEIVINAKLSEKPGGNAVLNIKNADLQKIIQENMALYDKSGDMHYDIISAFIKSMRGSDPDASIYWLARMIEGGEDLKFIARRILILAAEDIGLANPNALLIAESCFQAVHAVGYPEARIILAETVIYLASCPKSNSAYNAIESAIAVVRETGNLPVPLHLRNAPSRLMKDLGYGKEYKYVHSFDEHFVDEDYFPDMLKKKSFYMPGDNQREKDIHERLKKLWRDRY